MHINDLSVSPRPPVVVTHRHELQRRMVYVTSRSELSPNMLRLTLGGDQLEGFTSLAPDDHIRLFFQDGSETVHRDYTPRSFDAERNELVIDFALHEGGIASDWARQAKLMEPLEMGGPRGSRVIEGDIDHWLLIGDDTALPAMARRLEELAGNVEATLIVGSGSRQVDQLPSAVGGNVIWLERKDRDYADPDGYLRALANLLDEGELPSRTFIWIAGEANVAKALKLYLIDQRQWPDQWMKVSGYWKQAVGTIA